MITYGITYEAGEQTPETTNSRTPEIGIAVFESFAARDDAVLALREEGYNYFTPYRDVQGPGLSYARQHGPRRDARRNATAWRRSYR